MFLEYASRPEVDKAVVDGLQQYSPFAASHEVIHTEVTKESRPMFGRRHHAASRIWEPEITAKLDS